MFVLFLFYEPFWVWFSFVGFFCFFAFGEICYCFVVFWGLFVLLLLLFVLCFFWVFFWGGVGIFWG